MTLPQFMAAQARRPFQLGRSDCCLWLADWLVALGRPDPAAHLRGAYSTISECAKLLIERGGLQAVVTECAQRAGLEPTLSPIAGDIGVVLVVTKEGQAQAGAICQGRRWTVRAAHGLMTAEMTPLAAWRV